jgi:hypothetical protein
MAPSHVLWWHAHVQPVIDRDSSRTDQGWNWLLFAPFTMFTARTVAHQPAGYTVGMVIGDETDEEDFIPCALVLLVGRSRALDHPKKRGVFVWYLATAPTEALTTIPEHALNEDQVPKRLGAIGLDTALTHSFNNRRRGRMALYAADKGEDALLDWYRSRRMQVYPDDRPLPFDVRRIVRPSDGRYCYYTIPNAIAASRELDDLR